MDDLLKDAIADAKAVRETALENAKIALEEAFTPRLQSMLSKKIQSEMDHEDEEEKEEGMHDEDEEMEERGDDDEMEERGKVMAGAHDDEEMEERGDDEEMEERGKMDDDEEMDEDIIEIDGVKYAPVVSEEDEDEVEEGEHEEEDDMEEDLDLESVIKELESEIEEGEHEDEDDEKDEAVEEEVDAPTGIGSADNKAGSADKSSGIGSKDKAKFTEEVEESEEVSEETEVEEDIDLEEVLKALSEEEDEEKEDANEAVSKLQTELDEHRNVVKYLRSKLNEVNLLNAKLLFTNKLFRSHGLSNEQKMKVVETFDRATNLREVKLVYSTLAESFGSRKTKTEIKESKGSASKVVASTKSKKQEVISEGSELRDRFKKLAGIL